MLEITVRWHDADMPQEQRDAAVMAAAAGAATMPALPPEVEQLEASPTDNLVFDVDPDPYGPPGEFYLPSPETIARECAAIAAVWTDTERRRRLDLATVRIQRMAEMQEIFREIAIERRELGE